ncbi:hypothetical protein GGX14DRAFT_666347 [Mycena pura]|uniref:Uncharacterized protein n=1 Tax=Mycena pura TaxID=153505 RepID=A0AAD6V2W5_9AGAR|nr:hypothetical protein GGX14DRAFT_666347 [Mycena pura]
MSSEASLLRVPQEIWLHINRLAISDWSPLALAYSDRFRYWPLFDPFMEIEEVLRVARSFALVSRLWYALANEILFENIRVDDCFHSLYNALNRRSATHFVRSICFSRTRLDHNRAILACCPLVEIVVLPPSNPYQVPQRFPDDRELYSDTQLPFLQLPFLRHIYWTESRQVSGLLRKLVPVAPSLEGSSTLRGLTVRDISPSVDTDMRNLTLLHCTISFLAHPFSPATLPCITVLRLFGLVGRIDFATVFTQFPRLQELSYDVLNPPSAPTGCRSVPLPLIGLHSDLVHVVRDWTLVEDHFALLASPAFPEVQRIVLYGVNGHGAWHQVVADARFSRFRSALHARGCQLEFPEGHVLSP